MPCAQRNPNTLEILQSTSNPMSVASDRTNDTSSGAFRSPRRTRSAINKQISSFVRIVRGVLLKGVGASVLWSQMVASFLYGGLVLWLSAPRFRKKLDLLPQ
jgi:hypothetical protein